MNGNRLSELQGRFHGRIPVPYFSITVSPIIKKGLDIACYMWYITYVGYAYEYSFINPLRSMG